MNIVAIRAWVHFHTFSVTFRVFGRSEHRATRFTPPTTASALPADVASVAGAWPRMKYVGRVVFGPKTAAVGTRRAAKKRRFGAKSG